MKPGARLRSSRLGWEKTRFPVTDNPVYQVDYQVAAPAEMRTPNLHRAKNRSTKECGWKDGDRGGSAQTQSPLGGKRKTDLTLTGLLMEGLESQFRGPRSEYFWCLQCNPATCRGK